VRGKLGVVLVLAACFVAGSFSAAGTASIGQRGADSYNTPGVGDTLQIARMYGDEKGETHWDFINLLVGGRPQGARDGVYKTYPPAPGTAGPTAPLARVGLVMKPNTNVGFSMIAGGAAVPAIHVLARSYFLVITGPGFEWQATDGISVQARPGGPIFLADEQGSKGHITRGLGLDSVFVSIPLTGDSPKRPCGKASNVLDCLMGK
jgi:hypothetical protein